MWMVLEEAISMTTKRKIYTIEVVIDCPIHDNPTVFVCVNCPNFEGHYMATGYIECHAIKHD